MCVISPPRSTALSRNLKEERKQGKKQIWPLPAILSTSVLVKGGLAALVMQDPASFPPSPFFPEGWTDFRRGDECNISHHPTWKEEAYEMIITLNSTLLPSGLSASRSWNAVWTTALISHPLALSLSPSPQTSPNFHSGLNHDGDWPLPYLHPFSLSPSPGARRLILANQKNASLQSIEVGASSVCIAWGEVPANNSEIRLPL